MDATFWALMPPVVAIVLALITKEGIEFVSRDDALAAWQQAWLSVFLCLFCLGIMVFCVMVGIKMIKIILEFQRRGRTL